MKRDAPLPLPAGEAAIAQTLPAALAAGELSLCYEAQVCLSSGQVIGADALPCWHLPQGGSLQGAALDRAAEALGQAVALERWTLAQACRDAARWRQAQQPPVRIGIRLSAAHVAREDPVPAVRQCLADAGLPPQALGLQVPEAAMLQDAVAQALRPLRADGVEISLNDFGSGYASLQRMLELPVDLVKIDRRGLQGLAADAPRAGLTRAVIGLAHALHRRVLAVGVQTEEELRLWREHGCDRIQGEVFSAPLPARDFEALLASGRRLPQALTHRCEPPRTLLLVDDEPSILAALKRVFRRDGYRVLTAGSGPEGLALLATEDVDVILADQRMPGMTGVEFLRQAKEKRAETVRIALSGYTDLQSIIDAINEGAVYKFLTKPWDDEGLRAQVSQAFRLRELSGENRRLAREIKAVNTALAQANGRLESLARREHERLDAMTHAAVAARALVDVLPVAVFGLDPDGLLVYANATACERLPDWAAGLGEEPRPALRQALMQARQAPGAGVRVQAAGRPRQVRLAVLDGRPHALGEVVMVTEADDDGPCTGEPPA